MYRRIKSNKLFYSCYAKESRYIFYSRKKFIQRDSYFLSNILDKLIVHHINPITKKDVIDRDPKLFDPNNVVCVTDKTHKAIHYGDRNLLPQPLIIRTKNDPCPWKNKEEYH